MCFRFVLLSFLCEEEEWRSWVERIKITSFAAFSLLLRTAGRVRILVFALPTYQHIGDVHVSSLYVCMYVWRERLQSSKCSPDSDLDTSTFVVCTHTHTPKLLTTRAHWHWTLLTSKPSSCRMGHVSRSSQSLLHTPTRTHAHTHTNKHTTHVGNFSLLICSLHRPTLEHYASLSLFSIPIGLLIFPTIYCMDAWASTLTCMRVCVACSYKILRRSWASRHSGPMCHFSFHRRAVTRDNDTRVKTKWMFITNERNATNNKMERQKTKINEHEIGREKKKFINSFFGY